jgi:hypothetical protein
LPEVLFMAYWDGERWVDQQTRAPRQVSKARRLFSHSWQAVLEGALVSLLVVGLVAGTAFAGKGGSGGKSSGGGGTITLVDMDGDATVNHGDQVTFAVSTTATDRPFVALNCYQGSTWVYSKSVGYFADYPWDQYFILSNSSWSSGGGSCTAKLYATKDGTRTTTLATMTFAVAE